MLHSRLVSPRPNNIAPTASVNQFNRSKSSASFVQMVSKMDIFGKIPNSIQQSKVQYRVQSALKKKPGEPVQSIFPKVSSLKGKICKGKLAKPGLILSSESRNNPWAQPNPINENLINRKGLMEMINMGLLPKNSDFTELLNHKYEQMAEKQQPEKDDHIGFFPTNPNLVSEHEATQPISKLPLDIQFLSPTLEAPSNQEMVEKTTKRKSKKIKQKKPIVLFLPEEPIVLQINNQLVEKNEKYMEHLKKLKKTGDQNIFKLYIRRVEQFAVKYGLRKFQFKVSLNETKKISDDLIYSQILNARALGMHVAIRGSIKKRIWDVMKMFAFKFKFRKLRRELLKIDKIKRYYKIKKEYEEMTKKRCDLLKFRLSSFAERQRRFIEDSIHKIANDKFRVHIHVIAKSGDSYEEQQSMYKMEHRNNIELTRIFSSQPEHLVLLLPQEINLAPWLKLVKKIKSYHPTISPFFSNIQGYKVRTHNSIYYGINKEILTKIRKFCHHNMENACLFSGELSSSLVDMCEILNTKMYGSTFWKPHLQRLLQEDQDQDQPHIQIEKLNQIIINCKSHNFEPEHGNIRLSDGLEMEVSMLTNFSKRESKKSGSMGKIVVTEAQFKHLVQKGRRKQLRSYQLNNKFYSNKLICKTQILMKSGCATPLSVIFEPNISEKEMIQRLTTTILQNKYVNKWVLKIGNRERWSRGISFLETDSLKILKEKKKKIDVSDSDIKEVSSIMKVILLDKLQIPQNSLQDSQEFLSKLMNLGGYVEAVLTDITTECIFGEITPSGQFVNLATYSKIYTDDQVNCAATYPSQPISQKHCNEARDLADKLFKNHAVVGHVTFELLVERKNKRGYFIDICLNLDQYSSFYFMYKAILNNISNAELPILERLKSSKKTTTKGDKEQEGKKQLKFENERLVANEAKEEIVPQRSALYVPFIDNNGNIFNSFEEFEEASISKIKRFDYNEATGVQFLYLNLTEQKPDVLSLVCFGETEKKVLKYALDGLNFLAESGERTNKFDKRVERRAYDCLYIHDIIWKFRQLKKSKDIHLHKNTEE